jgi:hypothetical protein
MQSRLGEQQQQAASSSESALPLPHHHLHACDRPLLEISCEMEPVIGLCFARDHHQANCTKFHPNPLTTIRFNYLNRNQFDYVLHTTIFDFHDSS